MPGSAGLNVTLLMAVGSVVPVTFRSVNASLRLAALVATAYESGVGFVISVTRASKPAGVAGEMSAMTMSPACNPFTCEGTGLLHVKIPAVVDPTAFIVAGVRTTTWLASVVAVVVGVAVDVATPRPIALTAATLTEYIVFATSSPVTVFESADVLRTIGAAFGSGRQAAPPSGLMCSITACVVTR